MDPVTTAVEKKVAEGLFGSFRRWLNRNQELKKENETLKAELAEERSGRLAFEKLLSELECRPEDENIYWRKDGKGGPYCGVCLHEKGKTIPMTHGAPGAFYCCLHKQFFQTKEFREREANRRQQPKQPSYAGPQSWMR